MMIEKYNWLLWMGKKHNLDDVTVIDVKKDTTTKNKNILW
jgi:hypothetical protein